MATRRARILLGTLVEIRVDDAADAPAAIEAAFAEIADVHRLMSFHDDASDVARINQDASRVDVAVDARTHEVISLALEFARASQGRFDPTVACEVVDAGRLPRPRNAPSPNREADWRDIACLPGHRIRFAKPLWIDLGGIAKGYAVDRAIERLRGFGIARACVNAGGDLRRIGSGVETIHIRSAAPPHALMRGLQLGEGAVASSGRALSQAPGEGNVSAHFDGVSRRPIASDLAVSVVAERCVVADALTKIVLVDVEAARSVLEAWDAEALVHDASGDYRIVGRAA